MPIYHDCAQGSQEWLDLRLGIPTASCFDRIITPSGKKSERAVGYMHELLAESLTGKMEVGPNLAVFNRGHELEEKAVEFYEFQRDAETTRIGFVVEDGGRYGASPDRGVALKGDKGLLEIKCPLAATHIGYLLLNSVDKAYYPQIQGQLLVTGCAWVDIVSYHPDMPMCCIRVERDEEFIKALSGALDTFCEELAKRQQILKGRGYWPEKKQSKPIDWLITEEDVEMLIGGAHRA